MFGIGSRITRRVLLILALLLPAIVAGFETWTWHADRAQAQTRAFDDAQDIVRAAIESRKAAGPHAPLAIYMREAARTIADEAFDKRRNPCDWRRDNRLTLAFDAAGAPVREPDRFGHTTYPGSSIPGIATSALSVTPAPGKTWKAATIAIRAGDADCLSDGTAVGVLVPFAGGSFAALRLVAFDWLGFWELLACACGGLALFWLLAELVAFQFNRAVNRRIGHITAVLQHVERRGYQDRVPLDGGPEFKLLGNEINAMIARVGLSQRYFADLGGFVAHNLRSPITVARALIDTLSQSPQGNTPELIAELDAQLLALDRRCRDLLDRARMEAASTVPSAPVDLAAVIDRQVEDIFSYLASERDLEIFTDLVPAPVAVAGDTLELVIDNLLQNAVKFATPGTAIRIELAAQAGVARLVMTNCGPTIPTDRLETLFDRGITTGGHGLGLYAVRTAARLHGGDAVALPEPNGFRIAVTLPLA